MLKKNNKYILCVCIHLYIEKKKRKKSRITLLKKSSEYVIYR